jgi:hypothetical protein
MRDETANTILVGRAYAKHRFSHTDGIASDNSYEFADFGLLRAHEHGHVSQLPLDPDGVDFCFWVVMLCDPIGMLCPLFYQDEDILCRRALTRIGSR